MLSEEMMLTPRTCVRHSPVQTMILYRPGTRSTSIQARWASFFVAVGVAVVDRVAIAMVVARK
jgi:hypothetical protein